jgi:hypothetical protein
MSFLRHGEIYRTMQRASGSLPGRPIHAPPGLIVAMSFHLAIPWQVALLQSLPPLHQPAYILQESAFAAQCISSERRTVP